MFALLRNGTQIFTDVADKHGYSWFLSAKIGRIRVYSRPIYQSANIVGMLAVQLTLKSSVFSVPPWCNTKGNNR